MSVWSKLDPGLASIYANYLHVRDHGAAAVDRAHSIVANGGVLNVDLQYTGDLAEIEALGFEPLWKPGPHQAGGTIDLANLERLTGHPGVFKFSFGLEPKAMLDMSIPQIKVNLVWPKTDSSNRPLKGTGVIVGIIDSGIDFQHPFFINAATNSTRILRIWDQGLEPESGETSPAKALLGPGASKTYGVEYTDQTINTHLQSTFSSPVRHRDCYGHGTLVASAAAGNGMPEQKYVGVAPDADLIIVKYLALETYPTLNGGPASVNQRFVDAVSYILNVRKTVYPDKPVVINLSFGSASGPKDGFTAEERFLTKTFATEPGQICVAAAGNDGGRWQHARIDIPSGGEVTVPIALEDKRTERVSYYTCKNVDPTGVAEIWLWYEAGKTLSVEFDNADRLGFDPGPSLGGAPSLPTKMEDGQKYTMTHSMNNEQLEQNQTIERNVFHIEIEPNQELIHRNGVYLVKLSAPQALTVHLYCDAAGPYFNVVPQDANFPLPPQVHLDEKSQIGQYGGAANVITVGAYNAEVAGLAVANRSSRGPLVSYNYGSAHPQPDKPDIAAPGFAIDAAGSRDTKRCSGRSGVVKENGTSMSAPHVAGVIALMLQKNPHLTTAQVLTALQLSALKTPAPVKDEIGAGRLNADAAITGTPT